MDENRNEIEVLRNRRDIIDNSFEEPFQDLERIYGQVKKSFPEVVRKIFSLEAIANPLVNFRHFLVDEMNKYILSKSSVVQDFESKYAFRVSGFMEYLKEGGIVNINCVDERVKTNGSGNGDILVGKRFGLFLNEGLMGFLDFYGDNGAGEIWYAGKVLGNGFVRMIYEAGEDVRVDNWDIPFP